MGAGPRLTLEEVYSTFQALNLAGMEITTVSLYYILLCFVLRFQVSGLGSWAWACDRVWVWVQV